MNTQFHAEARTINGATSTYAPENLCHYWAKTRLVPAVYVAMEIRTSHTRESQMIGNTHLHISQSLATP